jgi:hypothetical protein
MTRVVSGEGRGVFWHRRRIGLPGKRSLPLVFRAGIAVKKIRLFGQERLCTHEGIGGQSGLASQGFEGVACWRALPPFNPRNHFLGDATGGGQLCLGDAIPLSPLSKRVNRKGLVLASRPARHARQHIPMGHTSTRKKYGP